MPTPEEVNAILDQVYGTEANKPSPEITTLKIGLSDRPDPATINNILDQVYGKDSSNTSDIGAIATSLGRGAIGTVGVGEDLLRAVLGGTTSWEGADTYSAKLARMIPQIEPSTETGKAISYITEDFGSQSPLMKLVGLPVAATSSAVSGLSRYGGEKLTGDETAGRVIGALSNVVPSVVKGGYNLYKYLFASPEDIAKTAAINTIKQSTSDVPNAIKNLEKFDESYKYAPYQTAAEVAQDPGLARLEDTMVGKYPKEPISNLLNERSAARAGDIEAVRPLNVPIKERDLSASVEQGLQKAFSQSKEAISALWDELPKDTPIPTEAISQRIKSSVSDYIQDIGSAEGKPPSWLSSIYSKLKKPSYNGDFAITNTGEVFDTKKFTSLEQLQQARSNVLALSRKFERTGDFKNATIANKVADELLNAVEDSPFISSEGQDLYKLARQSTALQKETFKGSPSLKTIAKGQDVLDEGVAREAINSYDKFTALRKAARLGGQDIDPQLKSLFITELTESSPGITRNQSQWLKNYNLLEPQMKEVFDPEHLANIKQAIQDYQKVKAYQDLGKRAYRGMSPTSPKDSMIKVINSTKRIPFLNGMIGRVVRNLAESGVTASAESISQNIDSIILQTLRDPKAAKALLEAPSKKNVITLSNAISGILNPNVRSGIISGASAAERNSLQGKEKQSPYADYNSLLSTPEAKAEDSITTKVSPDYQSQEEPLQQGELIDMGKWNKTPTSLPEEDFNKLSKAVAKQESGADLDDKKSIQIRQKLVSHAGAKGVFQLMPATAKDIAEQLGEKYDPTDADQNIRFGKYYLEKLLNRYEGNIELALAAYNWGMGNLEKSIDKHADKAISEDGSIDIFKLPNLPKETKNYVKNITTNFYT